MDLSVLVLSPLRPGDPSLHRARGEGVEPVLLVTAKADSPEHLQQLEREYALRDELDATWAARPTALLRYKGRPTLVLEDPGGNPLDQQLGEPLAIAEFLRVAIGIAMALSRIHARGLIHRDVRPTNILVTPGSGSVWFTGFGVASHLGSTQNDSAGEEPTAGTLAYIAPEQTGRMNRRVDQRSDLYSLGVTLYEMLTGTLPFRASDPLEWVHCHIARQPTPACERVPEAPRVLSTIVMKLLAKTADGRYQTASGLAADLLRCQQEWESRGTISDFPVAGQESLQRLCMPETLYDRQRQLAELAAAVDRVASSGIPELYLVSGAAGIGKTAIVNELRRVIGRTRAVVTVGKCDQFKSDVPYAAIALAMQGVVRTLLTESEVALDGWRELIRAALGTDGQLVVNLVPELAVIAGRQPPLVARSEEEERSRFQYLLQRIVGVFARREHPLVLVLDDVHWIDPASLDLLEHLLVAADLRYLFVVATYRDNEVDRGHPLSARLESIRRSGSPVTQLRLASLATGDLVRLLMDCLHCEAARAIPLAQLIHGKTEGNPFFVRQFMSSLAAEGLLAFDPLRLQWSWDLPGIESKGFSENVVDLMVSRLNGLAPHTVGALQQLACLGDFVDYSTLRAAAERPEEDIHERLSEAVRAGMLLQTGHSYRFVHDRIQETSYSSMGSVEQAMAHLAIGRRLISRRSTGEIEADIFETMRHLNRGIHLITAENERERVATLNLVAARRAKESIAYAGSLNYIASGQALMQNFGWDAHYPLMFALELLRAECEYMTGQVRSAVDRLERLAARAANFADLVAVNEIRVKLYTNTGETEQAVVICLESLRQIDVLWPAHPTDEEVRQEYQALTRQMSGRTIESLIDLPAMTDTYWRKVLGIMATLTVPANMFDSRLMDLVVLRIANLSVEHGNCEESSMGYSNLILALGPRFGDYQSGYRFGRLGIELVERLGAERFKTRAYSAFATLVSHWVMPFRETYGYAQRAVEAGLKGADLMWSANSWRSKITSRFNSGQALAAVQSEGESGLAFARSAQVRQAIDLIGIWLQCLKVLRGLTPVFGSFSDDEFDEVRTEQELSDRRAFAHTLARYRYLQLFLRYLAGDYPAALAAAGNLEQMPEHELPVIESADYHFVAALSLAADAPPASAKSLPGRARAIEAHHQRLVRWAADCPENFATRAALVGAELARLEGRELDAQCLYEDAIRAAQANDLVQNEAMAHELAGCFYLARGFEAIGNLYLQNARACYARWGAAGKVQQMDGRYPQIAPLTTHSQREGTLSPAFEQLDLATVVKVSEAVASEIQFDRLLDTLMQTALEHAGADRGLLLLQEGERLWAHAEATVGGNGIQVRRQHARVTASDLPESVLNYVVRTQQSIVLGEAAKQEPFCQDDYIHENASKSILCLPLIKQSKLIGVLYLENSLAEDAFTPARLSLLMLLASQAAASLENARLYAELRDAEEVLAQAQSLSHTGSFRWNIDDDEIHWSAENYRIFELDSSVQISLQMAFDRVHPEDLPRVRETLQRAVQSGDGFEMEHRLRMPGGAIKQVRVIGRATLGEAGSRSFIGSSMDVTTMREAQERLRKAQADLADASRMMRMGEFAASVSHEVTQPLAAMLTSAESCLLWLGKELPNVEKAKEAVERIVRDGTRAASVVRSIRAHAQNAPPRMVRLDINCLIEDTLELMKPELQTPAIILETRLGPAVGEIEGDPTQLQQVVVNLVMNASEAMAATPPARRVLKLTTDSERSSVLVIVADSGTGISPELANRIFGPAFTTKANGMGLGLAICRSIVEAHGGQLWFSPNPDGGSIFRFSLPRPPHPEPNGAHPR